MNAAKVKAGTHKMQKRSRLQQLEAVHFGKGGSARAVLQMRGRHRVSGPSSSCSRRCPCTPGRAAAFLKARRRGTARRRKKILRIVCLFCVFASSTRLRCRVVSFLNFASSNRCIQKQKGCPSVTSVTNLTRLSSLERSWITFAKFVINGESLSFSSWSLNCLQSLEILLWYPEMYAR